MCFSFISILIMIWQPVVDEAIDTKIIWWKVIRKQDISIIYVITKNHFIDCLLTYKGETVPLLKKNLSQTMLTEWLSLVSCTSRDNEMGHI